MLLFATDLDRTLIYSKLFSEGRDDVICVERRSATDPVSHMTYIAYDQLQELAALPLYVVPATTRSIEQYKRINLGFTPEFAITSNGGTILHKGEVYAPWQKYVERHYKLDTTTYKKGIDLLKQSDLVIKEPILVDNLFIYTRTSDIVACDKWLGKVLDHNIWHYTIQGNKVYVIPLGISKSTAVDYLVKTLGIEETMGAGDGKLDLDLVDYADIALVPKHGQLYQDGIINPRNYIIVESGITATEHILRHVKEWYEKHEQK